MAALPNHPSQPKPIFRPSRLEVIDVLRGIAALAVVVFHYSGHCQRYFSDFPFHFTLGKYGVHLFFVISGFFIYSTIEKCKNTKEFLLLRFSRLYPAYWSTLLLLLIYDVFMLDGKPWFNGYVINATMLQSSFGFPDIDIVYWSLAVEMSFYVLMAILLATDVIRYPLLVSLIWLMLVNIYPYFQHIDLLKIPFFHTLSGLLVHGPFFIGGMMFYLIKKTNGCLIKQAFGIIAACVLSAYFTSGMQMGTVALFSFALMGLALHGSLCLLVSPITLWLGAISYSLYLLHRNLGYVAFFKLDTMGVDSRISFLIVTASALLLASFFTYWIEKPSLLFFRRYINRI